MAKLVVLITSYIDKGLAVAEAWEAAGAPGVTIIESHGLHNLRQKSKSLEIPLFVSMANVLRQIEESNQTLFSVVEEDLVNTLVDEAGRILGTEHLDKEGAGIMFVLDVERTIGMYGRRS